MNIKYLFIPVVIAIILISGCSSSLAPTQTPTPLPTNTPTDIPTSTPIPTQIPTPTNTPIPVTYIVNLGVSIDDYDPETGKAGDIVFTKRDKKPFYEMGAGVLTDQNGNSKDNIAFEYHVDPVSEVFASADGIVVYFEYQEKTDDYEIGIEEPNKSFTIFYDHVTNPTISGEGDIVYAGDILGNPGNWSSSMGRFELQVNTYPPGGGSSTKNCPFLFFHPDLIEEYTSKIEKLMQDWETFKNSDSLYDEEAHIYPGCISNHGD